MGMGSGEWSGKDVRRLRTRVWAVRAGRIGGADWFEGAVIESGDVLDGMSEPDRMEGELDGSVFIS